MCYECERKIENFEYMLVVDIQDGGQFTRQNEIEHYLYVIHSAQLINL